MRVRSRTRSSRKRAEAYNKVAEAQSAIAKVAPTYDYYERQLGFGGVLSHYARLLVRAPEERAKPNGERLPEYRESST